MIIQLIRQDILQQGIEPRAVYINRKFIESMEEFGYGDFWILRMVSGETIPITKERFLELDLMNTAGT